ncbi:MAG: bifunctional 3-deoxy-7-phosphoheptulonate synthase/chorismate mutase [Acidobacteriota bacterium]
MDRLDEIREEIDGVDRQILDALARRQRLAADVATAKNELGEPLRDALREERLLAALISHGREKGLDSHFVTRVFHEIIDGSIRSQQLHLVPEYSAAPVKTVAFQGIEGAYSELAGRKFFAASLDRTVFVGRPTFEEAVESVEEGEADFAMLPVENTTAGSINDVYDLLSCARLSIVGEEVLRVEHCLLAVDDVPLTSLRRVLSHPQALAQCMKFLAKLPACEPQPHADTAMAVRLVKEQQDPTWAAIASEDAGRRYGLKVLRRNIEDQQHNYTRFVVVARAPLAIDRRIPCKTSIVMATSHEEGSLLRALNILHEYTINLTKLESRPIPGMPFQYLFYVDFEGNTADANVQEALGRVRSVTTSLKVLGSYPSQHRARTQPHVVTLVTEPAAAPEPAAELEARETARVPYRLGSRGPGRDDTVINVGGVRIGGPQFIVIAGPCAVESREQIFQCARAVKENGGAMLRGGCFKPRTSPYSFQGLGFEALALLAAAGQEYDLPIVTEVLSPQDVEQVARVADVLQVGARNMQNFSLLTEVGRMNRPVLLKRGMMSTMDEFLNAAEYILDRGNQQVILCERGIRTFDTATRSTLDLGSIPILKRVTHLPVVVDPSHAAGARDLVVPLALASHAVGPHGLMIEIHPDPERALSDGPQALRFPDFAELMARIYRR